MVKELFVDTTQRSAPRLESCEWQGVWDSMGKPYDSGHIQRFEISLLSKSRILNKLTKCLEKVCCHSGTSAVTEITARCWGLAQA